MWQYLDDFFEAALQEELTENGPHVRPLDAEVGKAAIASSTKAWDPRAARAGDPGEDDASSMASGWCARDVLEIAHHIIITLRIARSTRVRPI